MRSVLWDKINIELFQIHTLLKRLFWKNIPLSWNISNFSSLAAAALHQLYGWVELKAAACESWYLMAIGQSVRASSTLTVSW